MISRLLGGIPVNLPYLYKSQHSFSVKTRIVLAYLKIMLKYSIFRGSNRPRRENFLGLSIESFRYDHIFFLFVEIFLKGEYFFDHKDGNPVIIDCGANMGMSILYFKWLYPNSTIYAFEPDKKTFGILEKNIARNKFSGVFLFNKAVYNRNGKIDFFVDPKKHGSPCMSLDQDRMPSERHEVDCLSLADFMKEQGIKRADFLKIDIEGAEKEVALDLASKGALDKFDGMIIEYHHKIGGGRSELASFLSIFEDKGFEYQISAQFFAVWRRNRFQDILLSFYKKANR